MKRILQRLARPIWSRRSRIYGLLDRPGGRRLLALLATRAARSTTTHDVEILHDGVWLYRLGSDFLPAGIRFHYLHGAAFREMFEQSVRAAEDFWLHVYRPRPGDVVLDVGAGIGAETIVFSRMVGSRGRVVAVEANPKTFRMLEAQCRRNGLANVTPVFGAVTGGADVVYVEDREQHEKNTVSSSWEEGRLRSPVPGFTLDALCARLGVERIAFLKMNVEGAEAAAIEGMVDVIGRTHAACIACHDFRAATGASLQTKDPVLAFLRANGFTIVTRDDDLRTYVRDHVHATRDGESAMEQPTAERTRVGGPEDS